MLNQRQQENKIDACVKKMAQTICFSKKRKKIEINKIKFLQTYGQSCVHHNQRIDFLTIKMQRNTIPFILVLHFKLPF